MSKQTSIFNLLKQREHVYFHGVKRFDIAGVLRPLQDEIKEEAGRGITSGTYLHIIRRTCLQRNLISERRNCQQP